MNPDKFKYSILNKKLYLTLVERFTHYFIVIVFTCLSFMGIFFMIASKNAASFERAVYIFLVSTLIVLIFYFIQRRRLRFIVIDTILDKKKLAEVIDYVAFKRNWKPKNRSDNYYIATSYGGILGGSWGERITILYHENKIYFNSICDPNKKSSVTAWGRNKNHADIFLKAVKLLEANNQKQKELDAS